MEFRAGLGAGLAVKIGHTGHGCHVFVEVRVHNEALLGWELS